MYDQKNLRAVVNKALGEYKHGCFCDQPFIKVNCNINFSLLCSVDAHVCVLVRQFNNVVIQTKCWASFISLDFFHTPLS